MLSIGCLLLTNRIFIYALWYIFHKVLLQIIKEQNLFEERYHYESIYDKIHSFGYIRVKEDNKLLSKKHIHMYF